MLKIFVCLSITLLSIISISVAQKNGTKFEKGNKILVNLKGENSSAYQTIDGSSGDSLFILKSIPDEIEISFLENLYTNTKITFFNSDSDKIVFSSSANGKGQEKLLLSDFINGKVTFYTKNNFIVSIGNRPIMNSFSLSKGKTKILFFSSQKEASSNDSTEDNCTKKGSVIQKILKVDNNKIDSIIKCIMCNKFPHCLDTLKRKNVQELKNNKKEKDSIKCNDCSEVSKTNPSTEYICFYDVNGVPAWYLESIDQDNQLDIKEVKPRAGSEMTIYIKGNDTDEDYIVTADGKSFFFDSVESAKANQIISGEKLDTTKTKPKTPSIPTTNLAVAAKDALEIVKAGNKAISPLLMNDPVDPSNLKFTISKKPIPKIKKVALQNDYKIALDSIVKERDYAFVRKYFDSIRIADSLKHISNYNLTWKEKFLAVDKILENLNSRYANDDYLPTILLREIAIFQQGIKNCLEIPIGNDASKLKDALMIIRCSEVAPEYLDDCDLLIESIVSEYKALLLKSVHRKMFVKQFQVPDEDEFTLDVKSKKLEKSVLNRTFLIRGGFKIDFSSGIFFTGLANPDYILARSNFKYYDAKDSVAVVNGIPHDTTIYSGKVNDISGNFIRKNDTHLNYGVGLFAHGYWRSGTFCNLGGVVGLVLNNTGQAYGMLGGSGMFRAGKSRISLNAGAVVGKRQFLSESATPYLYNNEYIQHENGQVIYRNLRQVPKFYDNGAEIKVATYEKWAISYFFGISFNFATITLGSKKN